MQAPTEEPAEKVETLLNRGILHVLHVTEIFYIAQNAFFIEKIKIKVKSLKAKLPFPFTEPLEMVPHGVELLVGGFRPVALSSALSFKLMGNLPES